MSSREEPESHEGHDVAAIRKLGRNVARRYGLRSVDSSALVHSGGRISSGQVASPVTEAPDYLDELDMETHINGQVDAGGRHGAQLEGVRTNDDDTDRLSEGLQFIGKQTVTTSTTELECLLSTPSEKEDLTPVLGCREPTQWRPSENKVTQPMEVILNNTLQALANLLKPKPGPHRVPGPWFEGAEWEDPREFLKKIESYCNQEGYCREEWSLVAADRLKGDACRWYDVYKSLHLSFEEFGQRFLNRYDSVAERSRLQSKLYGQQQGQEEAAVFISRKVALYRRLSLDVPENLMVQHIREMLIPEIRMVLRSSTIFTIAQLTELTTATERDLQQINRRSTIQPGTQQSNNQRRSTDTQVARRNGATAPIFLNVPPYPCRFCRGDHYNRDCPNRRTIEAAPGPSTTNMAEITASIPENS